MVESILLGSMPHRELMQIGKFGLATGAVSALNSTVQLLIAGQLEEHEDVDHLVKFLSPLVLLVPTLLLKRVGISNASQKAWNDSLLARAAREVVPSSIFTRPTLALMSDPSQKFRVNLSNKHKAIAYGTNYVILVGSSYIFDAIISNA